jgi:hypothetical protein
MKRIILMIAACALWFSLTAVGAPAEIRSLEMSVFGMD